MTKIVRRTKKQKCIAAAKAVGIGAGKFTGGVRIFKNFPDGHFWSEVFGTWESAGIWIEANAKASELTGNPPPWSAVNLTGYVDLTVIEDAS